MKNKNNAEPAATEQHIQQLQDELASATERSRLAKRAVKDAKAEAKLAKRDKKQARKVLIAAQATLAEAIAAPTDSGSPVLTEASHRRIPDSPEVNPERKRRRRKYESNADAAAGTQVLAEPKTDTGEQNK